MSPSPEAGITPFQTVQARCVVCEKEARFTRLKSTLYSETKRDIDMRPVTILWSKKVSPRVDPKLFYFWQCPYCYFTADHGFFQQPFKDGNMSATRFRKQFLKGTQENPQYKDIFKLLVFDPGREKSVFMSGLKLNLLACYQWEQVEEVVRSECIQIASYYLRMAWMLHDLRHAMAKSPAIREESKALLNALRPHWPKLFPTEAAMLEKSLGYYQLALTKSAAIHTVLHEVNVRLLIARIHMKLSQMAEAKRAIIECKSRVKYYQSLIRKKSNEDGHFSAQALLDMETAHGKASGLLHNVEIIYDKIELTLFEREIQEAQKFLLTLADKNYEEKLKALKAKPFPDKVIAKVLPIEKKKSLIGYLKSS